jgi:hypothetical protein
MSRKDNERTQARVGLASNILGITAGAAALGTAVKNPALRRPTAGNAGPLTGRVLHRIKSPRGKAALIAGGAGGAIALQAANLGGDFVSNRVLSREAKMSKSIEQSIVSKSDDVDRGTGIGVNLEKGFFDNYTRKGPSKSDLEAARPSKGIRFDKKKMKAKYLETSMIEKRNFNAESDRQRRLGTYAGVGIGTGVVAGAAAGRGLSVKGLDREKGRLVSVRGPVGELGSPVMTKKWLSRRGGLAALAAVSAGGGIAAYKRGISERNRSYM